MNTKHAPGPREVTATDVQRWARLIAAAPETAAERDALREQVRELRAALEDIMMPIEPDGETGVRVNDCVAGNKALKQARAAIAKCKAAS